MSGSKPPTPNPSKDYQKSLQIYLKYLPQLLQGEQTARGQYDPQRIQEQLGLQAQYGPTQYNQQLAALQQLNPQGVAIRQQLGSKVSSDLASGYNLPSDLNTQVTSQIRGAEAARGNEIGNAPISAEALYKGNAAQQLYQQHLTNAGSFLAGATPEQQLLAIQPVTPDRSSQYVNPSAPGALAAPNYQNMLAAYQASQGAGVSPWLQAAQGIGQAAATYYGGPVGGAAAGAASNYVDRTYFSDFRLKNHVQRVGTSGKGYPIFEFCYNDCSGRFRGTIAQEILPLKPDAVTMDGTGFWKVDYNKLDIKLEAIPDLVEA